MLIGVHPPTHGDAFVFGYSVRDDLSELQAVMGTCPQDDILYWELTARHHLELYAHFKGLDRSRITQAVDQMLQYVALSEEGNEPVRTFSGGMKRRLSVAIAAIGDPQIIFLDEVCRCGEISSHQVVYFSSR